VKLIDFGIAKATIGAPMMDGDGLVAGKLAFMAPEQARGHALDRRADVFSLGIVLYLLTTGRHPFGFGTAAETLERIVKNAPVIPPCAADPRYPVTLERVVMRALAHDREQRFETAAELACELSAALELAHEVEVGAFVQERCAESLLERRLGIERALEQAASRAEHGDSAAVFVSVPPEPARPSDPNQLQHVSTTAPAAADLLLPTEAKASRRSLLPLSLLLLVCVALGFTAQRAGLFQWPRLPGAAALSAPAPASRPTREAEPIPSASATAPGSASARVEAARSGPAPSFEPALESALPAESATETEEPAPKHGTSAATEKVKSAKKPRRCAAGAHCAAGGARVSEHYGI
jgi:eukaryotic-like serine/threonine-protein kinase